MTDAAEFVPRRSARVASQKRDAPEPIAKPAPTAKSQNGAPKKQKTEPKAKPAAPLAETKASHLAVGDELPAVTLKDQDGEDVSVAEIAKTSTVVIFGMQWFCSIIY